MQFLDQSSNGMLDELGSPDLEEYEFLKNYEESDTSPFSKMVQQRDPLEFSVVELAKMNQEKWMRLLLL